MIVASIDIGTNTVLLLIAGVDSVSHRIIPLHNEYRIPGIGHGIKRTQIISPDKLTLLYEVLNEYNRIIKKFNCKKVLITGTNVFRIAKNTSGIQKRIKELFGYDLNVISGELEAEYAYLGAISNFIEPSATTVIDIGGSSTEIITGEGSGISYKISLQLGSVTATEKFLKHSPPLKSEIENLRREIQGVFNAISEIRTAKKIIAVAGTATTLGCIKSGLKEFDEDKVDQSSITARELGEIIEELKSLSSGEILEQFGSVMKGREDIILAGALILYEFMSFSLKEKVIVSTRGIRYGAIVKFLTDRN
jgi:exopolyphosphatase/guanosine-5'-triphosphate,3'-diphosphate pyrophosphatase